LVCTSVIGLGPLTIAFGLSCHDTAATDIYTLSLHDALPISQAAGEGRRVLVVDDDQIQLRLGALRLGALGYEVATASDGREALRSEEHTSELQSRENLVCRLLLEKKKRCAQRRCNENCASRR